MEATLGSPLWDSVPGWPLRTGPQPQDSAIQFLVPEQTTLALCLPKLGTVAGKPLPGGLSFLQGWGRACGFGSREKQFSLQPLGSPGRETLGPPFLGIWGEGGR